MRFLIMQLTKTKTSNISYILILIFCLIIFQNGRDATGKRKEPVRCHKERNYFLPRSLYCLHCLLPHVRCRHQALHKTADNIIANKHKNHFLNEQQALIYKFSNKLVYVKHET